MKRSIRALNAGQNLEVVAHSLGTIIASSALSLLDPEERQRIEFTGYAPAAWTYPHDLAKLRLVVNIRDFVPSLLEPAPQVFNPHVEYTSFRGDEYGTGLTAHSFAAYLADEAARNDPLVQDWKAELHRREVKRNLEKKGW